jgi:hypothetical protein
MAAKAATALLVILTLVVSGACTPLAGLLEVNLFPNSVPPDGTRARLRVVATGTDGKIGSGAVSLSISSGMLEPASVVLDSFGTGRAEVWCESGAICATSATIEAKWMAGSQTTTSITTVQFRQNAIVQPIPETKEPPPPTSPSILLLGGLDQLRCGESGLADPRNPTAVVVAFPADDCGRVTNNSAILVAGKLYYTGTRAGVHVFNADEWDWDSSMNRAVYPSPSKAPDAVLFASCGTSMRYRVAPSGRIIHSCQGSTEWFINGVPANLPRVSTKMMAFGDDDAVLFTDSVIDRQKKVRGLTTRIGESDRVVATAGGFFVISASDCTARKVAESGTVTEVGKYSASSCEGGRVDAAGVYLRLEQRAGSSVYEIYEYLPTETPGTLIYSEADASPPDYSTLPPKVFVTAKNSTLVGPNSL